MHEICVGFGFCGCIKDGRPLHINRFIPSAGPVTADQFVEWVFLADDMNPLSERKNWRDLKDKIRLAFVRHMGAEKVDATLLKWDYGEPYSPKLLDDPVFRKIEVWRRVTPQRAARYNCLQSVQTGEYRVCTVDFIDADGGGESAQLRYFVEAFLAIEWSEPGPWYGSLESAIADHDIGFENFG